MSAIDNVTQEDSAVSASAVSISAWDARKAQSFIGEGQERRYEAMKKPIAEDESSEESQVTEIPDDESETAMSAVSTRTVTSCRYRGRGRGRVMKSDRDDLPGTGLGRGGFSRGVIRAGIGRGRARPDDVVSVIEGDLSRVSLATKNESKVENGRGRSETEEVGPPDVNNRRPHVTGVKKENNTFTYNFDNIADLEFPRTVIDPRIQNVETCSMMGQLDSDDNEEGSKMFEQDDSEAGPSPQPAITRAESVCSLRDNFQYEESIDDYCESVSKVDISPQREPEKHQSLMPSRRRKTPPASPVVPKFGQNLIPRRVNRVPVVRRKIDNGPTESRQEKINFYKKKAESSRITEEEGEKEFHRPQSSAFRRSDYDSRDFTPLPTVQFQRGPMESKEEPPKEVKAVKREVEIVEPTVDTFRGFAHENDYQSEGREPRLLPAYQHLLNEYEKIVSIVIHVETKREERSLMNKSPHIDKVQRSIEAFKWRLYEEQQTFYQAPTVDYGPVIDLKEFKYEQTSEKRERQFPTEKVISVDVEKVLRDSQVRFQLKFKDVGEINIFFFRKSIDENELILFEAYPSHNFTGKTQFGMEIIPNKKYRDSKKKAKQFVFGNEMTNAMPMREIYIDSKFNKYFFDHNSTFTANIYVIGFEVYVSPCVRVVQLLQESQKQFRRGVKDYIDFINSPRDVHDDLVAVGDDSSDSEEFSSSS